MHRLALFVKVTLWACIMLWRIAAPATALRVCSIHSSAITRAPLRSIRSSFPLRYSIPTFIGSAETVVRCDSVEDIENLGYDFSEITGIGDVLLLNGDLGAGKTCFSRGVVRGMHNDEGMVVTSPTYLLDNTYNLGDGVIIHHMDLYRLPSSCDLNILGIPQIFTDSLCIIEWPQRMKHEDLPDDYVTVNIAINEDQSRSVRFTASSARWTKKIKDLMDDIIKDMQ